MSGGGDGTGQRAVSARADGFDLPSILAGLDADDPETQREAVLTIRAVVDETPSACTPTVPKLRALLGRSEIDFHDQLIACLAALAADSPTDVAPSTAEIVSFVATTSSSQSTTTGFRCLTSIAEHRPSAVVEHVDSIVDVLREDLDEWGLTLLLKLARTHPQDVAPAVPIFVTALEAGPERYGSTACLALGRLVRVDPEAVADVAFLEQLVSLVRTADPPLRVDALNCLSGVAAHYPTAVEAAVPIIARALESDAVDVRTTAAKTIARVAAGTETTVDAALDRVQNRLADDEPAVRRNACLALGYSGTFETRERLEALATADPDVTVRNCASWAVAKLEDAGLRSEPRSERPSRTTSQSTDEFESRPEPELE